MRGDARPLNFFHIGDQVRWTNCRQHFGGEVVGKVSMSEHIEPGYLKELENMGYIIPDYIKPVSHRYHRLIVAGKNKRVYFVVLGKAEKVKA